MGYTDYAGIVSRANSALGAIELIVTDRMVPAPIRLAAIAKLMKDEPILTDDSSAASFVRARARSFHLVRGWPY